MKYCNTGVKHCNDCWDWDKDKCKVGLTNPNEIIAARDKWWIERMEQLQFIDSDGTRGYIHILLD